MIDLSERIGKDFDKKNEIPKVKLDFPKLDLSWVNGALKDMENSLDQMLKDIRNRQDNAMAMEFTKVIGTLLRENGITPIMKEYNASVDNGNSLEMRYGYAIERLDFTEHDKVFEDKIKNLQEQIGKMEGKRKYLRTRCMEDVRDSFDRGDYGALTIAGRRIEFEKENKILKQRIAELENIINNKLGGWDKNGISYQEILDMKYENESLKKRISELESKETEKQAKINLNDRIKVKLTPLGAEIYYHQFDDLIKKMKANGNTPLEPRMPKIDKDGYTKMQLHEFISLYGEHIGIGKKNVIEPLDIISCE